MVRTMLAASCMLALGACSRELPQDESFATCLEGAGLAMPAQDASEQQVRRVLQETRALECAVDELDTESLRAWMRAAFEESETGPLRRALENYIATSEHNEVAVAEETGTLVGVMDQDASEWVPSRYDRLLAWEIFTRDGEPSGFEEWKQANPDFRGDDAARRYIVYLRDSDGGSPQSETWVHIDELEDEVRENRVRAADDE
jgi:hypothetical protein